jgi:hypothetical protein
VEDIIFFKILNGSLACPCGKGSIKVEECMEQWWDDINGKPKKSEKIPSLCPFVKHKITWTVLGSTPGLRIETSAIKRPRHGTAFLSLKLYSKDPAGALQ